MFASDKLDLPVLIIFLLDNRAKNLRKRKHTQVFLLKLDIKKGEDEQ